VKGRETRNPSKKKEQGMAKKVSRADREMAALIRRTQKAVGKIQQEQEEVLDGNVDPHRAMIQRSTAEELAADGNRERLFKDIARREF